MRISKISILSVLSAGLLAITIYCMQKTSLNSSVNVITQIDSFAQAAAILQTADQNTLVLFDVREVLYVPASAVFHVKVQEDNMEWLKKVVSEAFEHAVKHEGHYWSIWKQQEKQLLIEPSIVETIASLQKRGVKVLVLTSLMSGADFTIPSLPEWRFNTLKKLGFNFSNSGSADIVFTELPAKKEQHPIFYRGILVASGSPKGQVLGAFLDRTHLHPDKVIFFDDSMERVESVAQEMKKRSIPFYGYQYNGAKFVPGELDKEVAEFQIRYLVEHEKWLSEDEAREILKQKTSPAPC